MQGSLSDISANPVTFAIHKLVGTKVAIKSVPTKVYKRLTQENGISEAAALR